MLKSSDFYKAFVKDLQNLLTHSDTDAVNDFFRTSHFSVEPFGVIPSFFTLKINHYCVGFFDSTLPYNDLLLDAERLCSVFYNGFNFGVEFGVWRNLI